MAGPSSEELKAFKQMREKVDERRRMQKDFDAGGIGELKKIGSKLNKMTEVQQQSPLDSRFDPKSKKSNATNDRDTDVSEDPESSDDDSDLIYDPKTGQTYIRDKIDVALDDRNDRNDKRKRDERSDKVVDKNKVPKTKSGTNPGAVSKLQQTPASVSNDTRRTTDEEENNNNNREDPILQLERKKEAQFRKSYAQVTHAKRFKKHVSAINWQGFPTIPDKSKLFMLAQEKYEKLLDDVVQEFPSEENGFLRGTSDEREERKRWRELKKEWLLKDIENYQSRQQLAIERQETERRREERREEDSVDFDGEVACELAETKSLYDVGLVLARRKFSGIFDKSPAYLWMTKDPFSLMNWNSAGSFRPAMSQQGPKMAVALDSLERMLTYITDSSDEIYYCDQIAEHFNGSLMKYWNKKLLEKCVSVEEELYDLRDHRAENELTDGEELDSTSFGGGGGGGGGLESILKRKRQRADKLEEMKEFLLKHAAPWTVGEVYHFRKQQMDPMRDRLKMAKDCKEAYDRLNDGCLFRVRTDEVYVDGTPIIAPVPENMKLAISLMKEYRELTDWQPEKSPYTNKTTALQLGYLKTSTVEFDPYINALLTSKSDAFGNFPEPGESQRKKGGGNGNYSRLTATKTVSRETIHSSTVNNGNASGNKGRPPSNKALGNVESVASNATRTVRRVDIGVGTPKVLAGARNKKQVPASLMHCNKYPVDQFDDGRTKGSCW